MPRIVATTTWTAEEDSRLEAYRTRLKVETIAEKMGKTRGQVERRATYLGIRKHTNGYTVFALSQAFGCRQEKIRRWIESGLLKAERRNTDRERDMWYVSDAAVRQFIRNYYNEIDLSHVSPDWFFDIIFGDRHGRGTLKAPKDEAAIL